MATPIPLVFYRTAAGSEPVRDWLKDLLPEDRKTIGQDLRRLQFRWPVGMPLARPLGKGLWELRSNLSGSTISRMIFCFHQCELVVLNGFVKKTQQTPQSELDLALDRKKELER
jgi:phage-related protein